jgi:LuxR family maltose regulon positive regulatory protein
MIALEKNCLEESETYLADATRRSRLVRAVNWEPKLLVTLASLKRAQGQYEEALEFVQHAIDAAIHNSMEVVLSEAQALEAQIHLSNNHLSLVQRWIDSSQFDLDGTPPFERQPTHLVYARCLIATGDAAGAIPLLHRLRDDAQNAGRRGALIEISIVTALALKELGDSAGAVARLQDALNLGAELGFMQVFLKDWDALAPLLRNIAAREHDRGYAAKLVAERDGQPIPSGAAQLGVVEEVSRRELEVLNLVAVGMSNREIGNRLFISEKTVKKHVSNVMAKLGTSNRTQTADLARHLGIV